MPCHLGMHVTCTCRVGGRLQRLRRLFGQTWTWRRARHQRKPDKCHPNGGHGTSHAKPLASRFNSSCDSIQRLLPGGATHGLQLPPAAIRAEASRYCGQVPVNTARPRPARIHTDVTACMIRHGGCGMGNEHGSISLRMLLGIATLLIRRMLSIVHHRVVRGRAAESAHRAEGTLAELARTVGTGRAGRQPRRESRQHGLSPSRRVPLPTHADQDAHRVMSRVRHQASTNSVANSRSMAPAASIRGDNRCCR